MAVIRSGLLLGLFVAAVAVSAVAQNSDESSRAQVRERLREILTEANLQTEQVEATISAMEELGWEDVTSDGVESILPALGYAKREGTLPEDPEAFGEYTRALARSGSELTRLGFTSREAARTIAREVRRTGAPTGVRQAAPTGGAASEATLQRAQRSRLREKTREEKRDMARDRASTPGAVPGSPANSRGGRPFADREPPGLPEERPEPPESPR